MAFAIRSARCSLRHVTGIKCRPLGSLNLRFAILLVLILLSNRSSPGQTVAGPHQIGKVYVESFQDDPGAAFIRSKLIQKLSRERDFVLVDHVEDSDLILEGSAGLWLTGYHHSNPRIPYRTSGDTPVYNAKLSLTLRNRQGNVLWSASFKPRFWGSQYVSDNVTNQGVCHLEKTVRSW